MNTLAPLGGQVKSAAKQINTASTITKNNILLSIAEGIVNNTEAILAANQKDIAVATENGLKKSFVDRLAITPQRAAAIADSVVELTKLPDPVGNVVWGETRPNGLVISRTKVPLGVVGMIFESRPNVTVDAACLCIKSGNACILRGGKEAINTNIAFAEIIRSAAQKCGVDPNIVALVKDTSRSSATDLMQLKGYIDVIIPRGGAGLIKAVVENSTVPVIETGVGNCHIYVDEFADFDMAVNIIDNAKTQRPSVCNSVETLLVHKNVAENFLPLIKAKLDEHSVELRGCAQTMKILGDAVIPATVDDYYTEYNDYILAVCVVENMAEAITHIERYSSGHTEVIITENYTKSQQFIKEVDAAAVFVNASSRFVDGGEFGFGAEIGISTQKLHTRGPMGLTALTTDKYVVRGNGQVRG